MLPEKGTSSFVTHGMTIQTFDATFDRMKNPLSATRTGPV